MWGETFSDCDKWWVQLATLFTSDHILYGSYMFKVIEQWPISCENALTDRYINQKAWIGHAAASLALFIPEHITRKAWKNLTDEQKYLANKQAERAIRTWQDMQIKSKKLYQGMGGTLL